MVGSKRDRRGLSGNIRKKRQEAAGMDGVKAFTIMMKDTEVMKADFAALKYEVLNENYLPYQIRGKLRKMPEIYSIKSA